MCRSHDGECVEGSVHRIDVDLQLCVCRNCGQGWVRDVDAWTRMEESFRRLAAANMKLDVAINSLKTSLESLNSALTKTAKRSGV